MARNELELDTDPATLRKLVFGGLACVVLVCVAIGGAVHAFGPGKVEAGATRERERSMLPTSVSGWQMEWLSGGRVKADDFDAMRRNACIAIEQLNAGSSSGMRQPTCAQMHDAMRDPKALRAAIERFMAQRQHIR